MKKSKLINISLLVALSGFLLSELYVRYNPHRSVKEPEIHSSPVNTYDNSHLISDSSLFYSDTEESKLIVLRLMKNSCQSCIDNALQDIKVLSEALGKERVAVWAAGNFQEAELIPYQRLFRYDVPKFTHIRSVINPLDSLNLPYFFLFEKDESNTMQLVYYPTDKSAADKTRYFELLARKMGQ